MMQIIPVIDLLDGKVVHAKKGERQHYQPIQSDLTPSSEPLDIVAALLDIYPFTQLYIADLNAIQKTEGSIRENFNVVETITQCHPNLTLWVDAGISNNIELKSWGKLNIRLVIGSEKFEKIDNYLSLNLQNRNFILSLDFMPHGYKGPEELLTSTKYWPQDVIVMSLSNVGSNQGVNTALLDEIVAHAKDFKVYAAGGIRDVDDLLVLKEMGIHGALIASALHKKQISTKSLEYFLPQKSPSKNKRASTLPQS